MLKYEYRLRKQFTNKNKNISKGLKWSIAKRFHMEVKL